MPFMEPPFRGSSLKNDLPNGGGRRSRVGAAVPGRPFGVDDFLLRHSSDMIDPGG